MFRREDYEKAVLQFFARRTDLAEAYLSPTLVDTVCKEMQMPTEISAELAFSKLVADEKIQRTDGKTPKQIQQAAVARAQALVSKSIQDAQRDPLTREELDEYGAISIQEISRHFIDGQPQDTFAARYLIAVKQFGFPEPQPVDDRANRYSGSGPSYVPPNLQWRG